MSTVTIPDNLLARIQQLADAEGISVDQFVTDELVRHIVRLELHERMKLWFPQDEPDNEDDPVLSTCPGFPADLRDEAIVKAALEDRGWHIEKDAGRGFDAFKDGSRCRVEVVTKTSPPWRTRERFNPNPSDENTIYFSVDFHDAVIVAGHGADDFLRSPSTVGTAGRQGGITELRHSVIDAVMRGKAPF